MKQFVVVAQKFVHNQASMEELINSKSVVSVCFNTMEEAQDVADMANQTQSNGGWNSLAYPVAYYVMEFELDVEADGKRMQAQLERKGVA